jgi:hypothetical protein
MGTYVVTTDTSASGGTTTGNAYVNGFFNANTLIAQDALRGGNITSTGVLNIISNTVVNNSILTVGNATFYTQLGYISSQLSAAWNQVSVNNYTQIAMINANNGTYASADLVAYNDVGAASQNIYIDMGINSSGFTGAGTWTINGANDAYIYSGNSNFSIGTANNNYVNFFTNGTLAANERMRIAANGFVGIGNTAPDALLKVQGTANIIGNTFISGTINVASNAYLQSNVTVLGTLTASGPMSISSISGSVANTFLKISGSNTFSFSTIALGDLNNVTGVSSPGSGYVLAWNGSSWTATNPSGISAAVNSNTIVIANTEQAGGNGSIGYQWQVNGNNTTGYIVANSANIIFQSSANVQIIGSANVTGSVYGAFVGGLTGNVTGNANTSTKWYAPVSVTVAGDVVNSSATTLDGSSGITIGTALSTTGVTAGTYGNSTAYPVITVDAKGRITLASNQLATGAVSSFNTRTGAITLQASDVTGALGNVVQTNTAPTFTVPVTVSNTLTVANGVTCNGGMILNNTGLTLNAVSLTVTAGDVTSRDLIAVRNAIVNNNIYTGNSTVNTTINATSISFANASFTGTINAASFSGTAANATLFANYSWASPAAIGGTAPNTASFTAITATANAAFGNNFIVAPAFKAYSEYQQVSSGVTGATALDLSTTNIFQLTLGGNVTFSFTNPPPSTRVFSFTVIIIQDATGGRTVTWPAGTKFSGGVVPPYSTAANAVDVWSVMTYNGGSTYIASLSVKNAA